MLTDEELLFLNSQGLIPGPSETEQTFLHRIESLKKKFEKEQSIPSAHWEWPRLHLQNVFDFAPCFLPAFYSNRSLTPWQGAASWIEDNGVVSIQLREGLKKGLYWGYSRGEILAHEGVHAARSTFEEPQFEEFFAFATSEKRWRKVFGPLIRRPIEIWAFFVAIIGGIFVPFGNVLAACLATAGFWRLARLHWILRKAGRELLHATGDVKQTRALLMRLTDKEIHLFAQKTNLFLYAKQQQCLRWRLIRLAYLEKTIKK